MKEITGNLLDYAEEGKFDVIVHGCNCFHTMGSGIAREIRERYPQAYEVDVRDSTKGDKGKLGNYTRSIAEGKRLGIFRRKHKFIIINGYTQYNFTGRKEGKIDVDYDAIRFVMRSINYSYKGKRVGYPQIGAGLAGGDWKIISKIIEEELTDVDHTLVIFGKHPSK